MKPGGTEIDNMKPTVKPGGTEIENKKPRMKPGGPKEPKEPVEENESQYEIAVAPDPGEREEGEDPGGAEKEIQQEIEVAATAAVQVKVKLKGKVPEAGIAEVKVSGSTGMNKSYSWARMTPLCFNTERVLFRGPLGGNAVSGAAA